MDIGNSDFYGYFFFSFLKQKPMNTIEDVMVIASIARPIGIDG